MNNSYQKFLEYISTTPYQHLEQQITNIDSEDKKDFYVFTVIFILFAFLIGIMTYSENKNNIAGLLFFSSLTSMMITCLFFNLIISLVNYLFDFFEQKTATQSCSFTWRLVEI